jgi:ATP-dependent Clp protease ATP-binding subunit ClpA
MLFERGIFNPHAVGDERAIAALLAATNRASGSVRPSDLLAAVIEVADAKVISIISHALAPGSTIADLREIIEIYNPARKTPTDFDGRRERFSEELLAALYEFDTEFDKEMASGQESITDAAMMILLSCALTHLGEDDREYLAILDAQRCVETLREQVKIITGLLPPLFDAASNRLRSDEFTEGAWTIVEHAAVRAADLGYDRILPPHCFLALMGETEGIAEHLVRLQAQPEIGPGKVAEIVADAFRLSDRKAPPIELTRDGVGEATAALFRAAQRAARLWGAEQIDTPHLLAALLEDMPARLADALQRSPINMDRAKMCEHLDQYLRETRSQVKREIAFRLPPGLLPSEDLTYRARTEGLAEALHLDDYFEPITKGLYRRGNNHVLITGMQGVGKTTLVWELARRAVSGAIPFLKRKRFLWVDCRDVTAEESKNRLAAILSHVGGRTDLILCLDGLGQLLRADAGGNNKVVLRAALKEARVHLIGVMSNRDFEDLFSSDHEILEFFTRINIEEPKEECAIDMVRRASAALEQEYKVTIEEKAAERSVILSADYILNKRLPSKAINILRRACEDLDYDRTQRGSERSTLSAQDVIKVVSEISGVPEGTLAGIAEKADYEQDLGSAVVGQSDAVRAVATELRLIKAGLTDPGKPASVMLFAGLTGTGKTELAKALARFYSSSKRLQTYTMENFTEAHSVSGIIGVPPGYVGHEQGGRLINDLNSDPYCVFLLDEAEKAHPDVWKPFLNLFDEGWIEDTRAVKAFADRAIFLLTSNAGHELIAQMSQASEPMEKIIEAVKAALSQVRHERSNQPVFSPEFLARITRIIIFKPLDRDAMEGIARRMIARMQSSWKEKREKSISVPDALVKYVAEQSHLENKKSGDKEGGRIVRKLLREMIEANIQREAAEREREYKACDTIELLFHPPGEPAPFMQPKPAKVVVQFHKKQEATPAECVDEALRALAQQMRSSGGDAGSVRRAVSDCLARVEEGLKAWRAATVEAPDGQPERLVEMLRGLCSEVEALTEKAEREARASVERLIAELGAARGGAVR